MEVDSDTALCDGGQIGQHTGARNNLKNAHITRAVCDYFILLTSATRMVVVCVCRLLPLVGDPLMGHPLVYLQLNKVRPDQPTTCGYCGIRYVRAHGSHHGAH